MTFKDCDLVAELSRAKGKAKFLEYVIARHIGPAVKNGNGNNYYPGYAYIGKKRMAQALGSWIKEVDQWLLDIGGQCEHTADATEHKDWDCGCEPQDGLGELYISWGIDPSGQGALYCLTLNGQHGVCPHAEDGCPHAGKCLHGTDRGWQDEDEEMRWYCPHGHVDECPHEDDSRKRCICRSSQSLTTNGRGEGESKQGVRERVDEG